MFLINIPDFSNGASIPPQYAHCISATKNQVQAGKNLNPEISWSNIPAGTQSLAIIMSDPDVPADHANANKEGKVISKNSPRKNFYHWVLIDIPASISKINAGQDSSTSKIRKISTIRYLGKQGVNDFTWNSNKMIGGYDGPCPPWNDEKLHHYHFTVYALNIKSLGLNGNFNASAALAAMKGHVIGKAEWVGTYTLNSALSK